MKKKGISLILLVITIIIIIIIASAVILNLNNNNPVNKARLANVQSARDSLKSGINLYIGKIMVKENGNHNASTMILGKNSLVVNYSIVIDYSIYRTIRGNLNIWELDYDAINSKVNVKLDVYDSNSRWYIDEWGNPFLVYNSLENVSPYLKTEDGSAILASVSDFVVIPGDNQEFAYKGELYQSKKSRTNVVNSLNTYLANAKSAVSTASIKSIVLGSDSATSSYSIAEDNNQSNAQITLNGEETTLYKINTANFASKVGVSLPSYNSANWYIDENGNTYLIFEENVTIPESLSSSVYSSSYVTNKGGTIEASSVNIINNANNNNNQNGGNNSGNNNNESVNKEDGSISLSRSKGTLTYTDSLDITVTNPNNVAISAVSSDETVATTSVSGNTVTVTSLSKTGDATITIRGASNNSYNEVEKEFKVSVWNNSGKMPVSYAQALITEDNKSDYIGTEVDYTPTGGGTWRIFYLDTTGKYGDGENALYIKRDYDDNLTKNDSTYSGYTTNSYTAKTFTNFEKEEITNNMKKFNPEWGEKDGVLSQSNEYVCAYLCNPDEWITYKTSIAEYAIGSPSIEMYMDAYNQWGGYASGKGPQSYKFVSGEYGYSVGVDGSYSNNGSYQNLYTLSSGPNNIFYTSSKAWWLASPSREGNAYLRLVWGAGEHIAGHYNNSYSVCPIVCLGN